MRLHTHMATAYMAHAAPRSTLVHPALRMFTRVEDFIHYIVVAYILLVRYGPQLLSRCITVRCDVVGRVWHACMAVLYTISAVAAARALHTRVQQYGLYATMCNVELAHRDDVYVACLSAVISLKALSLLDTLFVCLRKAPVTPLHFAYHNASMLYFWHCADTPQPWALALCVVALAGEAAARAVRCCRDNSVAYTSVSNAGGCGDIVATVECDKLPATATTATTAAAAAAAAATAAADAAAAAVSTPSSSSSLRNTIGAVLLQCCRMLEAAAGMTVCGYVMYNTTPAPPGSVGIGRGGCTSPVLHVHAAMLFCTAYMCALLYRCVPQRAAASSTLTSVAAEATAPAKKRQ